MADFLDRAVQAHTLWRARLRAALDSGELPDAAATAHDDRCELGQWIHGDGRALARQPEYEQTRTSHAAFHKCAAEVIRLIAAGKKQAALEELDRGEYARTSREVILALGRLKKVR